MRRWTAATSAETEAVGVPIYRGVSFATMKRKWGHKSYKNRAVILDFRIGESITTYRNEAEVRHADWWRGQVGVVHFWERIIMEMVRASEEGVKR
jgi:hypothetical protein